LKAKFLMVFALSIVVSILSLPLFAHHGNAAYDTEKKITLKGTVTQWFWANPHCVLELDVKDDNGQVVHWGAETENPTTMSHQGWTKTSFKPGDEVTVTMITVKNGKPIGRITEVVLPNGQKLAGRVIPALGPSVPQDYPKQ
jgi:Family of unknown function (DUF6152)